MTKQIVIKNARIHKWGNQYTVVHPSNDAILAYCDTEQEAKEVIEALDKL